MAINSTTDAITTSHIQGAQSARYRRGGRALHATETTDSSTAVRSLWRLPASPVTGSQRGAVAKARAASGAGSEQERGGWWVSQANAARSPLRSYPAANKIEIIRSSEQL
jgi:hypothetical protein